ncbi:hypothetical protein AMECASPLE_000485 [Ameca splendens]|uniref:PP1-binding domain-containing protein n=1 Tax=Ameca splendens TaxID=208324 RepID=A0ABV0XLT1_9TELE
MTVGLLKQVCDGIFNSNSTVISKLKGVLMDVYKSRLAQIKARRRSSVGVRGSPETNSLIRFRAQQRMKTRPASHTPELVRSSPFSPRVAFTLRQKMASFQSLMDVVESDCDPVPVQDSDTGGCILTPDYLSDEISSSEEKENNPPATPTPSKKRCLGPLEGCSVKIREGNISIPHSSLKEQEDALCKQQSPRRPPSDDPSAVSPAQQPHLFHIPSLLEMKPTDVDKTPVVRKKKQVRFGGPLSPEFFDKNLPPSTPLQKGGTPAQTATPGGGSQLRSVLKTPQRSEPDAQHHRPEPLSPTGFGASPTFTIPAKHRVSHERGDSEDGKTVFPSLEQIDPAVSSDAECAFDAQPLNLNMAFLEESLSQNLRADTEPNKTSQTEVMDGREFVAEEKQPEGDAESRTQSKRRRIMKKKEELENEHRARPGQRKRKQPEDSEPVKRSMRTAAKSACRKMKVASAAARCWNKGVDRSLYGSRTYASKNPALSPITERLSFTSQSLAVQQTPESSTATHHGSVINLEMANAGVHSEQCAEAKAVENLSHNSVRLPTCSPGKRSRQPRSTVRRGQKKSKVSVADCEELHEELPEKHFEVESSLSLEVSQGTPSMHTKTEQCETDPEEPSVQISADIPCTDSSNLEYDASLCASTSSCTTLGEESNSTEPPQKQVKRGRRSSALLEPLHAEEHQPSCEVTGNGAEEQADTQSGSDHQEDVGEPNVDLAPWQADFNFEDVFKHTATRGQHSVRRSLRNQASSEHRSISAGLAWVPHTSPDSVKETRRRTRQRRLSAALPVQPPLPEETQDSLMNELRAKEENL